MSVKINVVGIKEATDFLKKKENQIEQKKDVGLSKAAIFVQGEVKASIAGQRAEHVSVDTGRFLNSVDFKVGTDDAIVYSDVEYADKLEYGTSKFPARMHFRNSKSRNQEQVVQILNQEVSSI